MLSLFKAFLILSLSFLSIVFISLFGNISLEIYLQLILVFIVSATTGAVILKQLPFTAKFYSITFILLSVFLGLFLLSFLTFANRALGFGFIALIGTGSIFLLAKQKSLFAFQWSTQEIIAIAIAFGCSLLFAFGDTYAFATCLKLPLLSIPQDDVYFFVNLVNSLSTGTAGSATYEINTPLNYQFIGYLPAAFITRYTDIPAHLSLYCFEFGLVRLLPFLLIIEWIKLYSFTSLYSKWYVVLAPLFFTLLQPLHPLYLLQLNYTHFVWSGLGYIGPSLNIGYSFSFPLVLVCLLLVKSFESSKSLISSALFVVLFTLLVGVKIPVFFAFGCFVFFLSLFIIYYKKDYHLFKCILLSVPLTIFLFYILFFGEKTGGVLSLQYAYFPSYFNDLFKFSDHLLHLKIISGVFILFLIWGSLRFFFLGYGLFSNKDSYAFLLYLSAFLALLSCVIVASVFDLKIFDESGNMIRDVSYDSLQFIRSSFFMLNAVAVLAGLFFLDAIKTVYKKIAVCILSLWIGLSATGLISNLYITPQQENVWLRESMEELKNHPSQGLLAINPKLYDNPYSVWLTAHNPGVFWTSNGGCLTTTKNHYRHELYHALLTQQDQTSVLKIKKEGVTLFVATPDDLPLFKQLKQKGLLQEVENSKWLFTFEPNSK